MVSVSCRKRRVTSHDRDRRGVQRYACQLNMQEAECWFYVHHGNKALFCLHRGTRILGVRKLLKELNLFFVTVLGTIRLRSSTWRVSHHLLEQSTSTWFWSSCVTRLDVDILYRITYLLSRCHRYIVDLHMLGSMRTIVSSRTRAMFRYYDD